MKPIRILRVGAGGHGENFLRPLLTSPPCPRYVLAGVVDPMVKTSTLYSELNKSDGIAVR